MISGVVADGPVALGKLLERSVPHFFCQEAAMDHDDSVPLPGFVIGELGRPDVHDTGLRDGGLLGGRDGGRKGDDDDP